jgi:predicted MFS family arabinose efflux permease
VKNLRLQVLTITLARLVLNTMQRMAYPYLPAFGRGLGVEVTRLSLALTVRQVAGVAGPLLASVAENRGRRAGMLFGLLLFSVGVGLLAIWPSFPVFILTLVLAMLGKYVFDPAMQAYLGDQVVYERRGLVLAVTELAWSFSFIAGVPLMGLLIARRGWASPFALLAGLGLLMLVILARALPRLPTPLQGRASLWRNLREVLAYPPALAGLSIGLLISAANEMVNLVFGVWMEADFGLSLAGLGVASAIIGFSELGGEMLAGGLVDRLGKPRAVAAGVLLNSVAGLALPLLGRSLPGALAGLFLFYITFEFTLVCSIPLMTEVLPAARATLMATNTASLSLGRALGTLLSAPLYFLGARLGGGPGILPGALVAVGFNLLALLALQRLRRYGVGALAVARPD